MQSITKEQVMQRVDYYFTHPNARSEWQFGIQATGGKLVGKIFAAPTETYSH